jgi:hypothetical protein
MAGVITARLFWMLMGLSGAALLAPAGGATAGDGGLAQAVDPSALTPSPASIPSAPSSSATPSPEWAGTVELYGFVPLRTTGSTTVRGFTADIDLGLGEVLESLQWASHARASVERGRWGLLTDLGYDRLGNESATTTRRGLFTGRAEVSTSQGIYDFALRYRFGDPEAAVGSPGQFSLIPYAGIRLLQAELNVEAQVEGPRGRILLQREGDLSRTWAQPLIGTQASLFLSPRLRAFARADVGGFGLAGERDLSGNAQLGLGYAVGNSTQVNVSWRYQGIEFDNGAQRPNGYTSYLNGIELGLKVFF